MSSTLNPRKCNFLVNLYLIGIVRYGMGNCFLFFFVAGLTRLNSVYSDNPRFSTLSGQQNVGFQLSHVGLVNNLTLIAMHSLSLMNVLTFWQIKVLDTSNFDINNNLVKISRWTCQWKFLFNPDINKQATEVYFSQSREKNLPLPIIFLLAKNIWALTSIVSLVPISIFSFEKPLLTIYKTLVKPHMEYTDPIYNKPFNDSFKEKREKVQYFAALAEVLKGNYWGRLCKELGLESLSDRMWHLL